MNFLQRTLQAITGQLSGLPAMAKLLIGSLMVILVLSLFLVADLTGRPSLVPLPVELAPETRAAALSYLEKAGIRHDEREGRLRVPAEQKYSVLAQLTDREVITGDQINFDSLIEQDSPFLTRDQHRKRWLIAKMNVLSATISRFRAVQRATVVIDEPSRSGFGDTHISPSASVNVVPRAGGLAQTQVEAIAHLVAGSHAGLKAEDVRVIDAKTGLRHRSRSEDELTAAKYLDVKRDAEKHVKATIEDALAYIPGVRIAVNAMVDTREVEQRTDSYEDAKIGPLKESSRTIDSAEQSIGAEPGVRPNTGVAISAGGGKGSTLTDERTDSVLRPVFPKDSRHVQDHKGYALKINATVGVPRSYFVNKYRQDQNDTEAVPDDTALDPLVTTETARIKAAVEPLIDTAAFADAVPGTVVVSMIPDFVRVAAAAAPEMPSAGGGWSAGIDSGLVRYVWLGGLVLLSLLMMFLMVRKVGSRAELPTAADIAGVPPPLPTDHSDIVGEAEESALALEGVELTDTALHRQQMLDQISEMVKTDPDEVANLLRRWIRIEA
ncbi:MAG: hypothetical protein ACYS0G_12105 [Planctomycetota bacterium]|jgi:flagellar M-ring protein FliF